MNPPDDDLLDRVRKLLAKAEAEGVTPHEAEALTAKAAELMARYGIDRALLAATAPDTDKPADRVIDVDNPWPDLLETTSGGPASAAHERCQTQVQSHIFARWFAHRLHSCTDLGYLGSFHSGRRTKAYAAQCLRSHLAG